MPSNPAARRDDPIGHTSMLAMVMKVGAGLVVGAVIGGAITLAAGAMVAATALTAGAAAVVATFLLSAVLMRVTHAGDAIAAVTDRVGDIIDSLIPPEITGTIGQGSTNVFINGKPAARAVQDGEDNEVLCSRHPPKPPQYVAEGSSNVFINRAPAHRKGDRSTCDAKTAEGSPNVFIGGETLQTREITSEMPPWLEKAGLLIGVALAICTKDWKSIPARLACLGMSIGLGAAADAAVAAAFGQPVHAATGVKLLDGSDDTDFALPARLPLQWVRRYSSLDTRDGLFGPGWSTPLCVQLKLHQPGEHPNVFIDEQGREVPFDAVQPGASQWNTAEGYRLGCTVGGSYIVEDEDGLLREFGPAAGDGTQTLALQGLEDRNGNALHIRRRGTVLHQLVDGANRLYTCAYDTTHPQRLAAIHLTLPGQDDAHTLVRYAYDASGRLAQVTDVLGQVTRRFTWHTEGPGAGLIASHTLPGGLLCAYEWAAYTDHPRVSRHWTDDGEHWDATYDVDAGRTTVRDALGREQHWTWNPRGQITEHVDALGHRWTLQWGEHGLLTRATQPNGGVWRHVYDDKLRLTEQVAPDGTRHATQWMPERPLPSRDTDALGHIRRYEYDDRQNLVAQQGPEGRTETSFDRWGQPVVQRNPLGGTSHWTWHVTGQPLSHTDCSQRTTRYEYDDWGHLAAITDALGHVTAYRHDPHGRLLQLTQPDGGVQHWQWDAADRPARHVDALGGTTLYRWTPRGRMHQRTDAAGHTVACEYDAAGHLTKLVNENRQAYRFEHDAAGRLTAEEGLDGQRTEYTLDAMGAPLRVRQAANTAAPLDTRMERDLMGRLVLKEVHHGGDPVTTRIQWDEAGQPRSITRTRRIGEREPAWLDQIDFDYDALGRLTRERSHAALPTTWNGTLPDYRFELRHSYDALGHRTATTLPDGRVLNYLYYGNGHLHQINLDGEPVSDIERDALHREVLRTQGRLSTRIDHDAMGRKTLHWTRHAKQGFGAATAHLSDGPVGKRYRYDLNGELTQRDDLVTGTMHWAYDRKGQVVQASQPAPSPRLQPEERFRYDPAANIMGASDLGWVENNRLRVFEDKRYEYDRYGRMTRKQRGKTDSARHEELRLKYNEEHQLVEASRSIRGIEQISRYHYDALGRRIAKQDSFGVTLFGWDGMRLQQETRKHARMTYVYAPESHEPLARLDTSDPEVDWITTRPATVLHFHNHVNGAPEELIDHDGRTAWRGRYATWGNLALQEYPLEEPDPTGLGQRMLPQNLRMQGQYADAETGLYYNTFRYFDPDVGRFVSQDPIGLAGGVNLYRFAANAVRWIDPWGWCASRHLGRFKGKTVSHIERVVHKAGFSRINPGNQSNRTWRHPDGSEVRVHQHGNKELTGYKSGNNAHVHKQSPNGDQLNDRGFVSRDPEKTHIGIRNPPDLPFKRGRPHGDGR